MTEPTPRRTFLTRGLALAAGAATLAGAREAGAAPGSPHAGTHTFHLDGRNVHSVDQVGARRLQLGDRLSGIGELYDGDTKTGEFYTTCIVLADPFGDGVAGRVEQHTFALPDGLLIGTGVVPHSGAPATFAIIGGTGAFIAARGVYVASFDPFEDGGDGVASLDFALEGV